MAEIRHDIEAGMVPAGLRDFGELHGHVDTNGYALQVIPEDAAPGWDAWLELANDIEAEVSRRLAGGTT